MSDDGKNTSEQKVLHRYEWETVKNVRTLVLKVDGLVPSPSLPSHREQELFVPDSSSPSVSAEQRLVLVIPGNPGSAHFYQDFAVALWESLDRKTPVWAVSHAGHVFHEDLSSERFDSSSYPKLRFQIEHKKWFISNTIPSRFQEIVLIGHSIGAFISLKVADELPASQRITRIIGLFPTIERMALSPHGKLFTPLFKYGRWVLFALVGGISWLPERLHRLLFRYYLPYAGEHHFEGVRSLARLPSFKNSILMAGEEMDTVTDLDHDLVRRLSPKTILYYGQKDHWCPVEYHTSIKELLPDARIHLCDKGFEHAFVLRDAVPVARMVADWIGNSNFES